MNDVKLLLGICRYGCLYQVVLTTTLLRGRFQRGCRERVPREYAGRGCRERVPERVKSWNSQTVQLAHFLPAHPPLPLVLLHSELRLNPFPTAVTKDDGEDLVMVEPSPTQSTDEDDSLDKYNNISDDKDNDLTISSLPISEPESYTHLV